MKKSFFLLLIAVLGVYSQSHAKYSTNSAYMSLYSQKIDLDTKDTALETRIQYQLIFKFNDAKAITLHHNYSIYFSFFEKLEEIEVITKNPQADGKIKTIKQNKFKSVNAKSSSVFYDDMQEINIDFLGLTVGSEAIINYTVSTLEPHFTEAMTFKNYLPVEKVYYELTVPDNIQVSFIEKNIDDKLKIIKTKEEKKSKTVYTWTANEVDEEKGFDSAPARLYYTPHILYKVDEYTRKNKTYEVSKNPKALYTWYTHNIKDINLKESSRIKTLADSITMGASSEKEKAKRVYEWVQKNIRYVAFEAGMEGLVPREAENVCNRRYGDCKDMSNLQYALLKAAGVKAHLTWIGTRRIPYTYSEVPLKNTDNHMIASYKDGNEWIFMDATDPNGIFGLPADHIQGKEAMIYISPSEYELYVVPVIKSSKNYSTEKALIKPIENDIEVSSKTYYGGVIAGNLANHLYYLTDEEKKDYAKGTAKRVSNNAKLNTFTLPKQENIEGKEFLLSYSIPSYIKEVGKEKYINLFLDKPFLSDAIDINDRNVPYAFKFNVKSVSDYTLEIPEGYKVSYIPENVSYKNALFGFDISYKKENNHLICTHQLYTEFPDLIMQPDKFPEWNQFIKKMTLAYKESVILEKN
ncbi:MAG: DUF3857 domain-containing protein [Chitinophagaceae bacterium]